MFHERIKQATIESHQRLEKQVVQQLRQIRNPDDYGALLSKFYLYFNALEQALAPFIDASILTDFAQRRKADRLRDDLNSIGYPLPEPGNDLSLPGIGNAAAALGALYVMEGSVMGGSIIVSMLQEKSNIYQGLTFFGGYGPDTGAMWQRFRESMNAQATDEAAAQTIIGTANNTFNHFSILFRNHEQEA